MLTVTFRDLVSDSLICWMIGHSDEGRKCGRTITEPYLLVCVGRADCRLLEKLEHFIQLLVDFSTLIIRNITGFEISRLNYIDSTVRIA